jgi:ATP-dependent DNA helicase RecG
MSEQVKRTKESFEECLNKILLPFREELKRGCKNDSVIGGFDKYFSKWIDLALGKTPPDNRVVSILDFIKQKFLHYGRIMPSKRAELLKESYPVLNYLKENPNNPATEKLLERLIPEGISDNKPGVSAHESYKDKDDIKKRTADKLTRTKNKAGISDKITSINGVGPQIASTFEKLGITTLEDLLFHLPREYQDRNTIEGLDKIEIDKFQSVCGTLGAVNSKHIRHGLHLTKTIVFDEHGSIALTWFNQPFIAKQLRPGKKYIVRGKIEHKYGEIQIGNPELEEIEAEPEHKEENLLTPVYPLTEGISQKLMRKIINICINKYADLLEEIFPDDFRKKLGLLHIKDAIATIHNPRCIEDAEKARLRIVFEEAFLLQLSLAIQKRKNRRNTKQIRYLHSPSFMVDFESHISFNLTKAQRKVINEILGDMLSPEPMNRLLQGDVGSGKTIVCIYFALLAAKSGYQSIIMAPTEILAEQHYYRFREVLQRYGIDTGLITGSTPPAEKSKIKEKLKSGELKVIVGTHALIQENVKFANPAFAVVDEQHRFGVMQRTILKEKGMGADFLYTTATPIPRSLCLTVYGELDVCILDEIPPGRQKVKTLLVTNREKDKVYSFIQKELDKGGQAYIICPVIEESEKLELTPLTKEFGLIKETFSGISAAMLHGRMKGEEKEKVMQEFSGGLHRILVSTTVVEVGVDVPGATIMAILDAHRFGLGQLHQLRGRIGRGTKPSICILVSGDESTQEASERLNLLTKTVSGFEVAEADLQIRGPGDITGLKQSGMPDFRFLDISKDYKIIKKAREEAFLIEKQDPDLGDKEYISIKEKIRSKYRSIWDIIH